jgi:hypothetical protein
LEPEFEALSSSFDRSTIMVSLRHKDCDFSFSSINIYGPYSDRVPFWETLVVTNVFKDPLTIVGGDLNFTLSLREIWGNNRERIVRGFSSAPFWKTPLS